MKSKVDPQKAREQWAQVAYRAYAASMKLNKGWSQLAAETKEAWCRASDDMSSALVATLDQEETFIFFLKLAMRDALTEDHISQLVTIFNPSSLVPPGKVRLIIAPDKISMPFSAPLQGRHDG